MTNVIKLSKTDVPERDETAICKEINAFNTVSARWLRTRATLTAPSEKDAGPDLKKLDRITAQIIRMPAHAPYQMRFKFWVLLDDILCPDCLIPEMARDMVRSIQSDVEAQQEKHSSSKTQIAWLA